MVDVESTSPPRLINATGRRLTSAHLGPFILATFVALALTYSVVIPPWEAPDENLHFRYANFILSSGRLPTSDAEVDMAHHPPLYYLLLAAFIAPFDRSGLEREAVLNTEYRWGDPRSGGHHVFLHQLQEEEFPYTGPVRALHAGRLLSVLAGALTVFAALRLGEVTFGESAPQALALAAIVAFLPSFVFTAATVHPDGAVAALGSLALWRAAAFLKTPTYRNMAVVGGLLGAMTLTKANGFLFVPLIPLLAVLGRWPLTQHRLSVKQIGLFLSVGAAGYLILAGPWLLRNQLLYGDPVGWGAILANPNTFPNRGPITVERILDALALQWTADSLFWHSFILGFGYMDHSGPPIVYQLAAAVSVVALLGLIAGAIVHRDSWLSWIPPFLLSSTAIGATVLALAHWEASFGNAHGRYAFSALPAMALAIVVGTASLTPWKLKHVAPAIPGIGLLVLAVGTPLMLIVPSYTLANRLSGDEAAALSLEPSARFGESIELVYAEARPARALPGGFVQVEMAWRARNDIGRSYRVFVQLLSHDGKTITQVDRLPGDGYGSTLLWRQGDTIRDSFTLTLPDATTDGVYRVESGFYQLGDFVRLPTTGASAQPGNTALLGNIKVLHPPDHTPTGFLTSFGGLLDLVPDFISKATYL